MMHEQLSSVALGTFTAVFEHHLLLLFFLSLSLCVTHTDYRRTGPNLLIRQSERTVWAVKAGFHSFWLTCSNVLHLCLL